MTSPRALGLSRPIRSAVQACSGGWRRPAMATILGRLPFFRPAGSVPHPARPRNPTCRPGILQAGFQERPTIRPGESSDCAGCSGPAPATALPGGDMLTRPLGRQKLVLALVVLGLALRSYHYLRDRNVWHDEAAILVNVLP